MIVLADEDHVIVGRSRLHSLVERVESKFGSMYVHCEYDDLGHVHGVSISYPGKHMAKEVGDALDGLNEGLNRVIEIARGTRNAAQP